MKKRLGFNIVVLGIITSGKETQARILRDKYALKFVETGVFSRNLMKAKTKDGEWAKRTVGAGKPLPTILLQRFLEKEITNRPKNKDLLFLGGRLKPEAQLIKKLIVNNAKEKLFVLYITLPEKEIYKRSYARKESNIKKVYKILDEKKIISRRIKWHKDQVGKTIKYYQKLGILKKINGNQTIAKVSKDIEKEIKRFSTLS